LNSQFILHIYIFRKRTIYKYVRGPVVCYVKFYSFRADSHYTSRFRSVAERHRSVKFSHV